MFGTVEHDTERVRAFLKEVETEDNPFFTVVPTHYTHGTRYKVHVKTGEDSLQIGVREDDGELTLNLAYMDRTYWAKVAEGEAGMSAIRRLLRDAQQQWRWFAKSFSEVSDQIEEVLRSS